MVRLTDDGGGMNLKAIRRQGRRSRDSSLRDRSSAIEDAMQLILEPGFPPRARLPNRRAAASVGRCSHRDQASRWRAPHGDQPGQGTVFTIRLPFTLAISHALVVRTGRDYALPLPTVEGVLRLSKRKCWPISERTLRPSTTVDRSTVFQHLATFVSLEPSAFAGAGRHDPGRVGAGREHRRVSSRTSWSKPRNRG